MRSKKISESKTAQAEVDDLEAENRAKDEELTKLQKLLKDRKDLIERTNAIKSQPSATASAAPV